MVLENRGLQFRDAQLSNKELSSEYFIGKLHLETRINLSPRSHCQGMSPTKIKLLSLYEEIKLSSDIPDIV